MTIKQKIALKEVTENHRSISAAMKEAGYKPSTYSKPKNLTNSKGWNELLEKYLPDDKLLAKHDEALEATRVVSAVRTSKDAGADSTDFIDVPDIPTRLRAVELGYKVKGHLRDVIAQQFNVGGEMTLEFFGDESKT